MVIRSTGVPKEDDAEIAAGAGRYGGIGDFKPDHRAHHRRPVSLQSKLTSAPLAFLLEEEKKSRFGVSRGVR